MTCSSVQRKEGVAMTVTRWVVRRRGDGMYLQGIAYFGPIEDDDMPRLFMTDREALACTPDGVEVEVEHVSVTISPLGAPGGARERVARELFAFVVGDDIDRTSQSLCDEYLTEADRILAALDAAPRPVEALVAAAEKLVSGMDCDYHDTAIICGEKTEEEPCGVCALRAALAAMKEAKT